MIILKGVLINKVMPVSGQLLWQVNLNFPNKIMWMQ